MSILITGITGFIGGHLCQRLIDEENHTIVALVRPQTRKERYKRFADAVQIFETELTNEVAIDRIFAQHQLDCVFHIAAMRGGGGVSKKEFDRSNIEASVVLANLALKYNAKFIFCSSVGVFGTIPAQLPPNENTPRNGDNYYHYTKIETERRLHVLQEQGLQLVIIRPIITYGTEDTGFPLLLIKLTDKGLLLLPSRDIQIHLLDVRTLVEAFLQAAKTSAALGKTYNITDKTPVALKALVNHIAMQLHGRPYPAWKSFPTPLYRLAEFIFARVLKSETWMTRVKLMSRDWYYDGTLAEQELQIQPKETIPNIDTVITWYKNISVK